VDKLRSSGVSHHFTLLHEVVFMARSRESIHIGVGGHVVAIDAKTGDELWRTKLKGASFVSLLVRDNRVYAGSNGELFCLDGNTGELKWHNKLKGLGLGFVTVSSNDSSAAAAMAAAAAAQAAAAAGAASAAT
jgi:outer membrane protein assembly factor BamB